MRGVAVLKDAVRFESADSTNVARNHCRTKGQPEHVKVMAARIAKPIKEATWRAPKGKTGKTSNFAPASRQNALFAEAA